MSDDKWNMVSITIFFLIVQFLLMIGLAEKGYLDYIRSVAVTTAFWIGYTFLELKYGLCMNNYVRAIVVLTLVSDGLFGYYFNLYSKSFIFDKLLHVFGTYAFSLLTYILIVQLLNNPVKRSFKFVLVICLGLSIGAFYEVLEFITDTVSHPILRSQPSLLDTDLDLIGDLIGSVFSGIHAVCRTFINEDF